MKSGDAADRLERANRAVDAAGEDLPGARAKSFVSDMRLSGL